MPDLVRVLMVEDVADDAALIERELRRAGITGAARRVDSERAYREALQTFAPDIILTDHSLPTFGAADALRIALLAAPDTPVIVVTGSLDEETAAEYIKAGAATPAGLELRWRHKDGSWRHIDAVAVDRLAEPAVGAIVVNFRDVSERRTAEAALRESEERYRTLVEGVRDIIFALSPEGTIASLNPAFETITGWRREEWVGRPFERLVHPEDLPLAPPGGPASCWRSAASRSCSRRCSRSTRWSRTSRRCCAGSWAKTSSSARGSQPPRGGSRPIQASSSKWS